MHSISAPQRASLGRIGTDFRMRLGRRARDHGCCLTFHRGVPTSGWTALPNRNFYLDLGYLARLITHLQDIGWDLVTMDEALCRLTQPGSRRFVNFSIDDGYRDTAEQVVPLFRRLGAPVTLYVTTGIPDRTLRLRNAGLETILQQSDQVSDGDDSFAVCQPEQKRAVYAELSARWEARGGDAPYLRFCDRHGFDPDELDERHGISWPMLALLRDDPHVEIGAHTVAHPRISSLPAQEALAELTGSRTRLEQALGTPVHHFAFPYGQAADCGPRDFDLAQQAGFASASTTCKGLATPDSNLHRLPRNAINGKHRHLAFAHAHLSGAFAVAARLLRRG